MSDRNQHHLEAELHWLRLLLSRRALWLRSLWGEQRDEEDQTPTITDQEADLALSGALSLRSEWQFYRQNAGALRLGQEIVQACAATERLHSDDIAGEIRLRTLSTTFDLSRFEEAVLVACLAPELDPSFATLYGYVQDDVQRRFPTAHLMIALFGDLDREAACRACLTPDATLLRYRLIHVEEAVIAGQPWTAQPLHPTPRITAFLLGANSHEERLDPVWWQPGPGAQSAWIEELTDHILARVDQRTNLTGRSDDGKTLVALSLCRRRGMRLMVLDPARLPSGETERHDIYRLLEREARLEHLAYFVTPPEAEAADTTAARLCTEMLESLEAPLFIDSRERWQTTHRLALIAVPRPDRSAQKRMWAEALTAVPHTVDGAIDHLVQQFDFGPETIQAAVAEAHADAIASGAPAFDGASLWQVCRQRASWRLEDLAQRIVPQYRWEDIVLSDEEMRQLREIAAQVEHRARVYEQWGFGTRLSRGRGITALFSGPSGTGKTMAAEILAYHLKLHLYVIDLAGIVSKYIGETEKNLRRVFDAAEQCGAILFFDEADALFGKRSEVKDSHDRYANIEVNYLLQKMEQYQGLAILSTNRKAALDRAFLRRLRFLVDFPFPNRDSRRQIWHKMFPVQAPLENVDFAFLAGLEIPGGNIRNVVLNAAFLASAQDTPIRTEHVMRAVRQEYAKIEKLVTEAEFGPHYRGKT